MEFDREERIISEINPKYEIKDWKTKKLKVCAYARVSTNKNEQLESLKNQKEHYERFIPEHPKWEYMGIYADEGISGTALKRRSEFKRMVEDCKLGKIDLVVVKDVLRFARNAVDCLSVSRELLTLNPPVGIYFEFINLNTLDVGNELILGIFAMLAQMESENKSKSVKATLELNNEKGDYLCPTANLLGYEKDPNCKGTMKIEPFGARTVRFIYKLYLSGYSQSRIAKILTGLLLPTGSGSTKWSAGSVGGILRNEKYCGALIAQKTYIESYLTQKACRNIGQRKLFYEPKHHDGIVSKKDHARALLLTKANFTSAFFNCEYEIRVIRKGLLSGFIPLNCAFGGYDAGHYLGALVMARVASLSIETEVLHIAGAKRVRAEMIGYEKIAGITISRKHVSFNADCVALMKDAQYVEILFHPAEKLLAVRKIHKSNKNAITWEGKPIAASRLCSVLFELMNWRQEWKYRIAADYFSKDDKRILMFDLSQTAIQVQDKESDVSKEQTNRNHGWRLPHKWANSFGEETPQYMMLCRRGLSDKLDDWNINAPAEKVEGFHENIRIYKKEEVEKLIERMEMESDE